LKLKGLLEICPTHTHYGPTFVFGDGRLYGEAILERVIGSEAICAIGLPSNKVLEMLVARRWLERIFTREKNRHILGDQSEEHCQVMVVVSGFCDACKLGSIS